MRARPRMPGILLPSLLVLLATAALPAGAAPKALHDATTGARASDVALAALERLRLDPTLALIAAPRHIDERFAVPSFLIGTGRAANRALAGSTPEQAARSHLSSLATYYRLDSADVESAILTSLNDSGRGGVVAVFRQRIDGIPVFRDEVKVLLDRRNALVSIAGSIPGRADVKTPIAFRTEAADAIATALADLTGAPVGKAGVHRVGPADGGYETYVAAGVPAAKLEPAWPIRARRVLFRLGEGLVPAFHVELVAGDQAPTYVIAAEDGAILLRHDRIASDTFHYRVWADGSGIPWDGPEGSSMSPHPTGLPDLVYPPFIAPTLRSLQNGPISTNDPWLAPGGTTTSGNNVDAYADLVGPDGYSAGDERATTTSVNTFDRVHDVGLEPGANATQRMASVTQLFYVNNFLHDWFYDAGFDESAGNAQVSNYGRGGVAGDPLLAEAQDHSGFNNATMMVPADGASPRMQMFLFDPQPLRELAVLTPAALVDTLPLYSGTSNVPPTLLTADVALPRPGTFSATASTLVTGSGPQGVHLADVSGDGRLDLVIANYSASTVGVHLADGNGGFPLPVIYAMGSGTRRVVTADLNNDGLRDLVSANFAGGSITRRLGTGGGTFGPASSVFSGTNCSDLVVGRFNGDTNDDILAVNWNAASASVFLGNGAGGFAPKVEYAVGDHPYGVAAGDLDSDGDADFVTANYGTNTMSVRLGSGTGTFGALTSHVVGSAPLAVALAELNGDGKLDAVTANSGDNTVSVALGNGLGGFAASVAYAVPPSPTALTLGDYNGDGLVDVVVVSGTSNSVSLLPNNGAGALGAAQTIAVGANPGGVRLGDVDGNGHVDVVTANSNASNATILSGTVTQSTNPCPPYANVLNGRIALGGVVPPGWCYDWEALGAAQTAGAAALLAGADQLGDFFVLGSFAIPMYKVAAARTTEMIAALRAGTPVRVTLTDLPSLRRDSSLDNMIVAHEWGHYLSNRLIGDASGLTNNQARGMGEGWSDFCALLMAVRPEDALAASNPDWTGVFGNGGHSRRSSVTVTADYYFGGRRYPYSTDFARNPLTLRHVMDGQALPPGPPAAFGADGVNNSEYHNTGEVWCNMLWECYASLLRATGRLSFAEAQDRMRRYLVQSLQMTPVTPTMVEARDALLMVAYANDVHDYAAFFRAFARRGLGSAAVAPNRMDANNYGASEAFDIESWLTLESVAMDDSLSCDGDDYLDANESGLLELVFGNAYGSLPLSATTVTVTSPSPGVLFPSGNTFDVPPCLPGGMTRVLVPVQGGAGLANYRLLVEWDDPEFVATGPMRADTLIQYANVDEVAQASEGFEAAVTNWTPMGPQLSFESAHWAIVQADPDSIEHVMFGATPADRSDRSIATPPLVVGPGSFSVAFEHWYRFEGHPLPTNRRDGGVVEISTDGGTTWDDVGGAITPGYNGVIATGHGNPLAGRPAFTRASLASPGLAEGWVAASANFGTTYAGQTVRLRFRIASDATDVFENGIGWRIDKLVFTGLANAPFKGLVTDPDACGAVAVVDLPAEVAFALAGANPARGGAAFRFALPRAAPVSIAVYDVAGRRVATLADGTYAAGVHHATWASEAGSRPGVYFARMTTNGRVLDQRVVVLPR